MPNRPSSLAPALPAVLSAVLLAACAAAAAPTSSTPTPIAARATTPEDAAALVIATNPIFAGVMPLRDDVIGASRWWKAMPLAGGGYTIEITIGWGDCPAGCIARHVWTYEVTADGKVTLTSETGDPMPSDLPQ